MREERRREGGGKEGGRREGGREEEGRATNSTSIDLPRLVQLLAPHQRVMLPPSLQESCLQFPSECPLSSQRG